MTARQISDGNDDGQVLGQSASDKVALHGASPVAQAAAIASPLSTLPSLKAKVISILVALRNKGIIAT